jgi:hypothetical protein
MSPLLLWLTVGLFALPATFLVLPFVTGQRVLLAPGLFVSLIYALVWLWFRPSRFVVSPQALEIFWPLRRLTVPRHDVVSAQQITASDLRRDFGLALRIGAGGLWGGFGCLWTSRRGLVDFYISRTDAFVLIERRERRPLLITPARPAEFLRALGA